MKESIAAILNDSRRLTNQFFNSRYFKKEERRSPTRRAYRFYLASAPQGNTKRQTSNLPFADSWGIRNVGIEKVTGGKA